jgi:hypothetical protein
MRAVAKGLVVLGVLGALGTGCASHDAGSEDSSRAPRHADEHDPVLAGCSSKIDAQIAAGLIPEADREYATGMCLRVP